MENSKKDLPVLVWIIAAMPLRVAMLLLLSRDFLSKGSQPRLGRIMNEDIGQDLSHCKFHFVSGAGTTQLGLGTLIQWAQPSSFQVDAL